MREDYVVIKETKRRRVAAALISLDPAETRGLSGTKVLAPNPGNRLHDQHPRPPASFESRQRNRPTCRGQFWALTQF
jgi:hypothetical protein